MKNTILSAGIGVGSRERGKFKTTGKIESMLKIAGSDVESGRYRISLYRFLTDSVPAVSACVSTWARLTAAPGRFRIVGSVGKDQQERVEERLNRLLNSFYQNTNGNPAAPETALTEMMISLFRDGMFAGIVTVHKDGSGVDRFLPLDPQKVMLDEKSSTDKLIYELNDRTYRLDTPDFYYIPLSGGSLDPLGRSILKSVPFVTYIEQQLVDDMRRSSHNSGFHRLHVSISPPERMSGESDQAYIDRINGYFDSTVSMIKSCDVDDNPVTWDNVEIKHVGPTNVRGVTNSWFVNHRAMIEEICAGTNLAPFMLGYSYGATTTWAGFKFDLVMRQVRSIQSEVAHFLEWLAHIDLSLAGIDTRVSWEFDNTLSYQAGENANVQTCLLDNVIKLYQAGLLDKETAVERTGRLL